MKIRVEQIEAGEEEVIIRCRKRDARIRGLLQVLAEAAGGAPEGEECVPPEDEEEFRIGRITAFWEGYTIFLDPGEVYYLESVEGVTYAYLREKVVKIPESLKTLEALYGKQGFFRCSKSMILNIQRISYLKSEPGSRIRATLENGEQVIISRKYGKELRRILKGGNRDEV